MLITRSPLRVGSLGPLAFYQDGQIDADGGRLRRDEDPSLCGGGDSAFAELENTTDPRLQFAAVHGTNVTKN